MDVCLQAYFQITKQPFSQVGRKVIEIIKVQSFREICIDFGLIEIKIDAVSVVELKSSPEGCKPVVILVNPHLADRSSPVGFQNGDREVICPVRSPDPCTVGTSLAGPTLAIMQNDLIGPKHECKIEQVRDQNRLQKNQQDRKLR